MVPQTSTHGPWPPLHVSPAPFLPTWPCTQAAPGSCCLLFVQCSLSHHSSVPVLPSGPPRPPGSGPSLGSHTVFLTSAPAAQAPPRWPCSCPRHTSPGLLDRGSLCCAHRQPGPHTEPWCPVLTGLGLPGHTGPSCWWRGAVWSTVPWVLGVLSVLSRERQEGTGCLPLSLRAWCPRRWLR